jgi:4-hydroxybenzoate polyprenyltransferase
MAFIEITGQVGRDGWVVYMAFAFWTVSYDIIYALQDINDDKKIGVKSMAIILGDSVLHVVEFLNIWFVFLLLCTGVYARISFPYFIGCLFIILILRWQKKKLELSKDTETIAQVFQSNNFILLILLLISFLKVL